MTDPGGNITRYEYDDGGMLYALYQAPATGAEVAYINSVFYDAQSRRQAISYGNGTTTLYTYDANTFRITRLYTQRGGVPYQDLNYWYDPVGNITITKDAAQRTLSVYGQGKR